MAVLRRRRSIGTRLTVAVLVAALGPLTFVGLIVYYRHRNTLTEEASARLDATATLQQAEVDAYLTSCRTTAALIALTTPLRSSLAGYLAERDPDDLERITGQLVENRAAAGRSVLGLHVVASDGTVLASTDRVIVGNDYSDRLPTDSGATTAALRSTFARRAGVPIVEHAAPLGGEDDLLGLLVVDTALTPLFRLLNNQSGSGDGSEFYLVDEMDVRIDTPESGAVEIPDRDDDFVIAKPVGEVLDGTDWSLVARMDRDDALAPVSDLRNLLLFSLVIVAAGAGLLAHRASGRLTEPLHHLTRVATEMSGDGHGRRANADAADEIGDLARAFNRLADRQELATNDLEGKNDQLQQFLYVSSHDLKTPLRAISSYGQLLAADNGDQLDDAGRGFLEEINTSAAKMYELIDDLLAYVRAGQIEDTFEAVNLDALLVRVRQTQALDLERAGATLSVSHLGSAFGSAVLLEEVFANLVGNSIKYRRPDVPARIGITAAAADNQRVTVRIEDNGIGIPPEHRERVFQPFHRLHRKDDITGSGVGLAICQRVIVGHGGSIKATGSNLGGTAIDVTLPRFSPHG